MLGITELTYTALISFLIVVILGPIFIPMLTKFKFGQTVRDDGPKTHLAKNGTPTMGGILMIVAILITGLTRSKVGPDMAIGLICIFGFGLIGFIDDFIKLEGFLVTATPQGSNTPVLKSSAVRYDGGAGACEVMYVTSIKWLKEK